MVFHRNVTYGIKAIIYLSTVQSDLLKSSKEIAESLDIPKEFVSKILQKLSKSGIVYSRKGNGGGFCLAKDSSEIRIIDIINGLDEPVNYNFCLLGMEECGFYINCPVKESLQLMKIEFYDLIYNFSINDITSNDLLTNPNNKF